MVRTFFIVCAVLVIGCSKKENPVSTSQPQRGDYFPVSVGKEFLYNHMESYFSPPMPSAETWEGTELWRLIDSSRDAVKYYYHFRNIRHLDHAYPVPPEGTTSHSEIIDTLFFTIGETVADGLLDGFPYQGTTHISRYSQSHADSIIVKAYYQSYTFKPDKGLMNLDMAAGGNTRVTFALTRQ